MVLLFSVSACGVQSIPRAKNQVDAAAAEVDNQYKRRADLVPNLVQVVKGYAKHESDTLTAVTEARAKATGVTLNPDKLDAEQLRRYQEAQGELNQALGRLLVVVERYPELKADQRFRELQAQLEGTENRITVARNRYIKSVQDYNVGIRTFPNNLTAMVFGYKEKPNFTVANEKEISVAPKVDFNPTPAPAPTK